MQREFYISCIKINGIPLLPPLMTDSMKEEMKYYKSLAIKVEEKLKARQLLKSTTNNDNKCVQADRRKSRNKLQSTKCNSDSDASNHITSDTNNSDSYSNITIVEHLPMKVAGEVQDKHNPSQSPVSNIQYPNFEICSTNSSAVDLEQMTFRINENQYVNTIEAITPNKNIVLSENWKPEIPKTLDIIPIASGNLKYEEETTESVSKESENPPKLSRQGSYVLDTPSPMLIAHLHTELMDNYVPTPTHIPQRKQWNIAQSKMEWENKQFVTEDIEMLNKSDTSPVQENSEHTESKLLTESYQANKFINDTETKEIAKEHTHRSDITPINPISNTAKKELLLEKSEKHDDTSCILDLADKLQKSMRNINSLETQLSLTDENEYDGKIEDIKDDKVEDTKDGKVEDTKGGKVEDTKDGKVEDTKDGKVEDTKDGKVEDTKDGKDSFKAKSPVISDKLLTVYKEIEELHKKQMIQLMDRQHKEQSLLQAEFQKQQMFLLAEIQKRFSGMSHQTDTLNVTSNQLASSVEGKLDVANETRERLNAKSPSKLVYDTGVHDSKLLSADPTNVVCPLDYISSQNLYLLKDHKLPPFITDTSPIALNLDFARKINLCDTIYNYNNNSNNNNNNNDDNYNSNPESQNRTTYKNSNVNRQLFPLDSNTTHIPVSDTSMYHNQHIQAVNIINAYTRGFLVRRLMRTERVIILKKIYKEALQCMLKLHVDAPLNLSEVNFLHRLQLQCDAASMNLVELFAQSPAKRMKVIALDREIRQSRMERPSSARSYSFATQKTLARKNPKEFESTMTKCQRPLVVKKNIRSRCQTWASDIRLASPNTSSIRRSTSTGAVRKPWR